MNALIDALESLTPELVGLIRRWNAAPENLKQAVMRIHCYLDNIMAPHTTEFWNPVIKFLKEIDRMGDVLSVA